MALGDDLKQAIAALDAGDLDAAAKVFLQIRPEHGALFGQAQLHLGKLYQRQGNRELAEQSYRTAARQTNQPSAIFQLAEFLFQQKRLEEAEPVLRRILTLDPKFTDAHIRMGMIQRDREQIPEAIRSFERAIANDQRAVVARYMLAQLCLQTGNLQRSLSQLYFVLQLQPNYLPARILQADLLQRMGDHRQALVELCQIISLGKADAGLYVKLGHSYQVLEDDLQAAKAYEKAFAMDRTLLSEAHQAATMREALGQPMKALPLYRVLAESEEYREQIQPAIERIEQALSHFNLGDQEDPVVSAFETEPVESEDEDFIAPPIQSSSGTAPLRAFSTAPLSPPPAEERAAANPGILESFKKHVPDDALDAVKQGLNFFKRKMNAPNDK